MIQNTSKAKHKQLETEFNRCLPNCCFYTTAATEHCNQ